MGKLISIPLDDGTNIYVETTNLLGNQTDPMQEEAGATDRIIERSSEYLDKALCQVKKFSKTVSESIKGVSDEVEVEFAIKFTADAGIIISSVSTESSITVKLKWAKDN